MKKSQKKNVKTNRRLKSGDPVMIISGGNKKKRELIGKTGTIRRFVGADRVIIEGLNMVIRNKRASGPDNPGGRIEQEAPVHISNVMYFVEKLKRPVRIKYDRLSDGKKVRGYLDPESKKFVQID